MKQGDPVPLSLRTRLLQLALAAAAGLGVIATLDAAGDYPALGEGPGLSVDEMFNVVEGWRLVNGSWLWVAGEFHYRQVWGEREDLGDAAPAGYHLPDHPPLGRLALGLAHELVTSVAEPAPGGDSPFVPTAARFGSAIAFAFLVYLVGLATARWYGGLAGATAAVTLVLMPRLFAHAHLASLETMTNLAWTAAVFSVAHRFTRRGGPRPRDAVVPGLLLGLALLTKIQAVLLLFPVAGWAAWHWRSKAVLPLLAWGGIGLAVFCLGWPWLWLDPLEHLREYFTRATERVSLSAFYLGTKYPDRLVPWHYSLVMFATTVPLGLHLLAAGGLASRRWSWHREPRAVLLVACVAFPVLLFCIPGIAVYDGSRLFLVVFPLWAVLVGKGASLFHEWLAGRLAPRRATLVVSLLLASQAWGLVALHPCGLSFYNLAVGGPRGAQALGFEPTYWGDSLTRSFLGEVRRAVPEGEAIAVFPSTHPAQWTEFLRHARTWETTAPRLVLFGTPDARDARYVMIFRRKADLPDFLRTDPPGAKRLAEVTRCGVTLAVLYEWADRSE